MIYNIVMNKNAMRIHVKSDYKFQIINNSFAYLCYKFII